METRFLLRATQRLRRISVPLHHLRHEHTSKPSSSTQQVNPIGDYYASILESPLPTSPITPKPPITTTPSVSASSDSPTTEDSGPSILFSSRLSSPLERRSEIMKRSKLVGGIWVPPRPDEPDNCCMSGCVNCVWDRYRDELEEWAAARKEAEKVVRKERSIEESRKRRKGGEGLRLGKVDVEAARSMDDDGGGSEGLWDSPSTGLSSDLGSEDLFSGVPVGIREFMKQEKRLKEKHAREGTVG